MKGKLTAIIEGNCPRCRKAGMFVHPPVHWKDFTLMLERCAYCGLRFQVEPGFFIGAIYISYLIIVGIILATAIVLSNFFDPETWVYIAVEISVFIVFLPAIYRISRILFLYWFGGVKYDKSL
ncbi:MAG: DUF983 domain-containing protein [Bacteroidetes bacterium]|nr:DUF983 domain-containing protein [Bacteroidota bacterium]MDA1121516.1 DUF983 domain-containing protein [Bacteroidota bacterium]